MRLLAEFKINFMFDRYISTKTELSSNTYANYMYTYDHYVREDFGKKIIGSVRYSDILGFYNYLLNDKNLSIGTVDSVNGVLFPSFQLAVRDDIIRKNPCDGVLAELKRRNKHSAGVKTALTLEQQRAFLNFISEDPVYNKWLSLMVFLFGTGCRIGEAIGIRWKDLDMERRVIDINHNVTYGPRYENDKTCSFMVSDPKTLSGFRQIPMMDEVYEVLMDEYERQEEEGFCEAEIDGYSGFVFSNRFGEVNHPSGVNRAIERIRVAHNTQEEIKAKKEQREAIIIPHFSCHQIRHTFCTRLCEHETNIKVIQSIMGHADIQTTMNIYAEATLSRNMEAMDLLSKEASFF